MNYVTALAALVFTGFGVWIILRGWRASKDGQYTRRKASLQGEDFADATILMTVVSIFGSLANNAGNGGRETLLVQVVGAAGLLCALIALPHLARPLIALLAGLFVVLSVGFPASIILVPLYFLVALSLSKVRAFRRKSSSDHS